MSQHGNSETLWENPYRILFSLGALVGVFGVSLWLLMNLGWVHFYPRMAHANLMFFGCFWSFVAGFLMTAIPKMLGVEPAQPQDALIATFLVLIQVFLSFSSLETWSASVFLVQIVFLFSFILRRFIKKPKVPFAGFAYIPLAFIHAGMGTVLSLLDSARSLEFLYLFAGEAFLFNLILGLGGRLVPVISRLPNSRLPNEEDINESSYLAVALALVFNATYWMQVFYDPFYGILGRILIIAYILVFNFKIFTVPKKWSISAVTLKLSASLIMVGHVLMIPQLGLGIAGAHLAYIGGVAVLTLAIATRVMLAHSDQPMTYEVKSKRFILITVFLFGSAILRVFSGSNFLSLTMVASALLFIAAFLVWLHKFLMVLKPEAKFQVEQRL